MPQLSVLIPARHERWLAKTIVDVLAHAEADTEVIAVLDGAWPEPGFEIAVHPRVHVVYLPTPIGQRAATNLAARLSDATYVMKIDAHVSMGQGFDRILIAAAETLGPDVTQIPAQTNLHIYDQVCDPCGFRADQAPQLADCPTCHGPLRQDVVWTPRRRTRTTAWRFDHDLHFQYSGELQARQTGDICDVMTSLGACFFMRRDRFWALNGLDEGHGSWGAFGVEIACKSWLSGGRQVVNKATTFSHFFRVGGIGFPYEIHGSDQDKARAYSRHLWLNNGWAKQVRPLRWLVEKFAPVPDWTPERIAALPAGLPHAQTIGVVYYSDCRGDATILEAVRARLTALHLPLASVTLSPVDFGDVRIVLPLARGYLTMFRQILAGLESLDTDVAFLVEHDVLYSASHFEFRPARSDRYYYNQHVWKVDAKTGRAVHYRCSQTSGLCADRQLLIAHYRKRIALVEAHGFSRKMGFEPGTHRRPERVDEVQAETWTSAVPNVDIRHAANLTPSRWSPSEFRNKKYCAGWIEADAIPGWGQTWGRFAAFLHEHASLAVRA